MEKVTKERVAGTETERNNEKGRKKTERRYTKLTKKQNYL